MAMHMERAIQFEAHFLPLLKDVTSLLSRFQGDDLNNLYTQLMVVNRMEESLESPILMADAWRLPPPEDEEVRAFWNDHTKTLKSFKKNLEDKRNSVRDRINERSRYCLRSLNILDMPDEILAKICEHVRDDSWYDVEFCRTRDPSNPRDIQNLRLTCWRLCNTSSHLLIRLLNVALCDESSLAHFEKVSMHPTISKGILLVCINLSYYDSLLATDFMSFVEWNWNGLIRQHREWASSLRRAEQDGKDNVLGTPKDVVSQRLKKIEAIIGWWSIDSWEPPVNRDAMIHHQILRRGYKVYQRRFEVQQNLRESGRFVETVGAAMARMPRAKKLTFQDDNLVFKRKVSVPCSQDSDDAMMESIAKNMLIPYSWYDAYMHMEYGPRPADMIVKSIVAIHKAGVLPTQIHIEITAALNLSTLAPSEGDLEALRAAVGRLKTFNFIVRRRLKAWPAREPGEREDLQKFITAILDTESLENLGLYISGLGADALTDVNLPFSIGSILNARPRPMLSELSWDAIPLHSVDLEEFLDSPRTKMWLLHMKNVHLLSGTWADVLDILRNASISATIFNPTGAECDEMSPKRMVEIFGGGWKTSEGSAERYVEGWVDENPLRNMPAEDPPGNEDSSETDEPAQTEDSDNED